MSSGISVFLLMVMLVISIILFVSFEIYLASMVGNKPLQHERVVTKERIRGLFITPYQIMVENRGGSDITIDSIYVFAEGISEPLAVIRENEEIDVGSRATFDFHDTVASKFRTRTGHDYVMFWDTRGLKMIADQDIPGHDKIDFGANGFSLRRSSQSSYDAILNLNLPSTSYFALCFWIKIPPDAGAVDVMTVHGTVDMSIGIGVDGSVDIRVGPFELNGLIQREYWNHLCLKYYPYHNRGAVRGFINSKVIGTVIVGPRRIQVTRIDLHPDDYWIDDLYVGNVRIYKKRIRRIMATSSDPTGSAYLFRFEKFNKRIERVEVVTDSGRIFRLENPYWGPQINYVSYSGTPSNQDLGNVFISGFLPLSVPADMEGTYFIYTPCSGDYVRYWNGHSYGVGVRLVLRSGNTVIDDSGGAGLQIVTTPMVFNNETLIRSLLGREVNICMMRTDGAWLNITAVLSTVTLEITSSTGDQIEGVVNWIDGTRFIPRTKVERLTILCIETGDFTYVQDDGSFQLELSHTVSEAHLMILTPRGQPLVDRYPVPLTGVEG